MTPSSRDRISVDLHGLKAALFARAQATGSSPSDLVRQAVARSLGVPISTSIRFDEASLTRRAGDRIRLGLSMQRDDAAVLLAIARRSGMRPGDYMASLLAGVPVAQLGGSFADHIAALTASSSELSTLSRDIHHLTHLLRQGDVVPALAYRETLKTLDADIRRHLLLAADVLAHLQARSQALHSSATSKP